jgi:hypothetical protein
MFITLVTVISVAISLAAVTILCRLPKYLRGHHVKQLFRIMKLHIHRNYLHQPPIHLDSY